MKIAATYSAVSSLLLFFCWWGGVDLFQRGLIPAYAAFSSLLLAGPITGLIATFWED